MFWVAFFILISWNPPPIFINMRTNCCYTGIHSFCHLWLIFECFSSIWAKKAKCSILISSIWGPLLQCHHNVNSVLMVKPIAPELSKPVYYKRTDVWAVWALLQFWIRFFSKWFKDPYQHDTWNIMVLKSRFWKTLIIVINELAGCISVCMKHIVCLTMRCSCFCLNISFYISVRIFDFRLR